MDYIFTFLWSMVPVCELRCAIPLGMETYDLPLLGTQGYDLPWYGVFPDFRRRQPGASGGPAPVAASCRCLPNQLSQSGWQHH